MGSGGLRIRKKPAAVLSAGLLCIWLFFRHTARQPSLPEPCYNHGSAACVAITADPPMRAYTGLQQVVDGSPGQCEQRRFGHEGDGGWYLSV